MCCFICSKTTKRDCKQKHRRLHTNLYYDIVNNVVIMAYQNAGNDKEAQRQAVLAALKEIRTFVENLNSNPIFW